MRLAVISSKGGVGKTTLAANLAGLLADCGLRVLMVDADPQPTLSSYYALGGPRPASGLIELLLGDSSESIAVATSVPRLDLVVSNDSSGRCAQALRLLPDGARRLGSRLTAYSPHYDVMILDTPGSAGPLQDAAILAADQLVCPVLPEILSARELQRGTLAVLDRLRLAHNKSDPLPNVSLVLNRVDQTRDARHIRRALRSNTDPSAPTAVRWLHTEIPNLVVYRRAASQGVPVHRLETRVPKGRQAPAAWLTLVSLADELLPDWQIPRRALGLPGAPRAAS